LTNETSTMSIVQCDFGFFLVACWNIQQEN